MLKGKHITETLIGLLVLVYVIYQGYLIQGKELATEVASYGTVSDTIQVKEVVVLRSESLVQATYSGVLSYNVADGGKIAKDGIIAEVYDSEADAVARNRLKAVNEELRRIDELEQTVNYYYSDTDLLSTQIGDSLVGMLNARTSGRFSDIDSHKDRFLVATEKRNFLVGTETTTSYAQRKAELITEQTKLDMEAGRSSNAIKAEVPGYFISKVDGYESLYGTENAASFTVSKVRQLLVTQPEAIPGDAIGKVCEEFNWYLICVVDGDDIVKLNDMTTVDIRLPLGGSDPVTTKIIAKNYDTTSGEVALVLQCAEMNENLARLRKEPIQIETRSYSGVLVKETSVHFDDYEQSITLADGTVQTKVHKDVKGVYVRRGGKMVYVQIFSERSINGYVVCKTKLSEEEQESLVTGSTIQLYDEVITEGEGLYDGKLI